MNTIGRVIPPPPRAERAFSLVELSIVLVILGLLAGGILAGKSLVRASELRAVTTEYQRYLTATRAFRDKYFALPGDITNATSFWGAAHATPATCKTTIGTGTQTCDGNGDGRVVSNGSPGSFEHYRFWQHLANAGLIEGTYDGVDSTASHNSTPSNSPYSRLNSGVWFIFNWGVTAGTYSFLFDGAYNNSMVIGAAVSGSWPQGALFKPEELWNIDSKLDDGQPATGKLVMLHAGYSSCTDASAGTTLTASYLLTTASAACAAVFRGQF